MERKHTAFFIGFCLAILSTLQCFSQAINTDTIAPCILNTTGGSAVYGNIGFEWSIGEATTTETMTSYTTVITHGILQSLPTSRYHDTQWSDDEIKIYPIPTNDWLTIQFFSIEIGKITLTIYDAGHKLVYADQFHYPGTGLVKILNVSRYASGTYFLRIELGIYHHTESIQKYRTNKIQVLR